MTIKTQPLDLATLLETDDDIRAFLQEALEDGNTQEIIRALNIAARAKGMTSMADQIGVARTSLYKSLSEDGNPRFDTVMNLIQALGLRLSIN